MTTQASENEQDSKNKQGGAVEDIQAEECRENKAFRINTGVAYNANGSGGKPVRPAGPMSSRSGDNKKIQLNDSNKAHMIRVKNVTRARNTGSVGAAEQKNRDRSLGQSTQQSTP